MTYTHCALPLVKTDCQEPVLERIKYILKLFLSSLTKNENQKQIKLKTVFVDDQIEKGNKTVHS